MTMLNPWILQRLEDARQADLRRAAGEYRGTSRKRRRAVPPLHLSLRRLRRATVHLAR